MESKLVHGLFFAGELLDYDGVCGGFNLNWAFNTGLKAGRAAMNSRK
jgi:predicted flavoprotein YhiN